MTKRMNVRDARARFGDLLGSVYYGKEPVILERRGRPMAVMISPEQWERYQRQVKEGFFTAVDRIQERNRDEAPEDVEETVTRVVEEVRRERYEQQDS